MISLFFLFCMDANAQCKFKSIKKLVKYALSDDCYIDVDVSTKPKLLYNKYRTSASASFVKSDEDYYLFFYQLRGNSSRYEILKNNTLDIIFEEGEPVLLQPCGDFYGKRPGISLTAYSIGCFYHITKEQLQRIADNIVNMVILHYTADHDLTGGQIDEDGSSFFEYIVRSDNRADNAPTMASCILSK